MTRPRDERDLLNLPKPDTTPPVVHERTVIRAEGSSGQLEAIGKAFEGMDGKKYLGSAALHIYIVRGLLGNQYIFTVHSVGVASIPEVAMVEGTKELAGHLLERYGHKRPAKTTDKNIRTSEHNI